MLTRGEIAVYSAALQALTTIERTAVPGLAIEHHDGTRRSHDVFLVGMGCHPVDLRVAGVEAFVRTRYQSRAAILPAEVV